MAESQSSIFFLKVSSMEKTKMIHTNELVQHSISAYPLSAEFLKINDLPQMRLIRSKLQFEMVHNKI